MCLLKSVVLDLLKNCSNLTKMETYPNPNT